MGPPVWNGVPAFSEEICERGQEVGDCFFHRVPRWQRGMPLRPCVLVSAFKRGGETFGGPLFSLQITGDRIQKGQRSGTTRRFLTVLKLSAQEGLTENRVDTTALG